MPQFNPEWFASQLFWLLVTFVVLYLLMSRIALPRVAQILQERQEKVSDDLAKAERLKTEAQEIYQAYESSLQEARSEAQKVLRQASEDIAAEQSRRHEEKARELEQQIKQAEARIEESKQAALENLNTAAAEIAQAATVKLIGGRVAKNKAEAAVKAATGGADSSSTGSAAGSEESA
jgi:F-type H+-transporting ATPase subunit b